MKVIVTLEDPAYGKVIKTYECSLKRRFAISWAINEVRDDYSLRMYSVTDIRTSKS